MCPLAWRDCLDQPVGADDADYLRLERPSSIRTIRDGEPVTLAQGFQANPQHSTLEPHLPDLAKGVLGGRWQVTTEDATEDVQALRLVRIVCCCARGISPAMRSRARRRPRYSALSLTPGSRYSEARYRAASCASRASVISSKAPARA